MSNSKKKNVAENPPYIEYLAEFKALIDACGHISYFSNMRDYVAAGINKAKLVASAFSHDFAYFDEQSREWGVKAKRSYAVLKMHAENLGYEMPKDSWLINSLTYSKDRREAYKGYLGTCLKQEKTISPSELEAKFQARLKKRLEKA